MTNKNVFFKCSLIVISWFTVSCGVDNTYDLDEDIDLTMQFNVDGLSAKLGSTEKILLKDIISKENNSSIKEKDNLLYVVVGGENTASGQLPTIPAFSVPQLNILDPNTPIFQSPIDIPATSTERAVTLNLPSKSVPLDIDIPNIPASVKELHSVTFESAYLTVRYAIPSSNKLVSDSNNEITFRFPSFIKSAQLNANNEYKVQLNTNSRTFSIKIDAIELPANKRAIEGGTLALSENITVTFGTLRYSVGTGQSISAGEKLLGEMNINFSSISPKKVTGIIDYTLSTPNFNMAITQNDIPDFIRNIEKISIKNPTLKVSFTNNPIPMVFSGNIKTEKASTQIGLASIPATNIEAKSQNVIYLSPTDTPFDSEEYPSDSQKVKIDGISTLLTQIPDNVKLSLSVGTNPTQLQTVELGKTYTSNLKYNMFIPLEFASGFSLTYSDTTSKIDLKDYDAERLEINLDVENTIPLGMKLNVIPLDEASNVINGLEISTISVSAGSLTAPATSNVSLQAVQKTAKSISKIHKFRFEITANGAENGGSLLTTQYIKINNIRVKLKGSVIRNFN